MQKENKRPRRIFEKIKKFPKFDEKEIYTFAQWILSRINTKIICTKTYYNQIGKRQRPKKNLKSSQGKVTCFKGQGISVSLIDDFSLETIEANWQ